MAKAFDIGDLWDVIRTASCPTRAVINDCWYKSLAYSISTSTHGVNMLTNICQHANLGISNFFNKMPKDAASELVGAQNTNPDFQSMAPFMGSNGANTAELYAFGAELTAGRQLRAEWRHKAYGSNISNKPALDAIKEIAGEAAATKYANALMPNYRQATLNYHPKDVLRWAIGQQVESHGGDIASKLKYRDVSPASGGGPKLYDHAWLVVKGVSPDAELNYRLLSRELKSSNTGTTPSMLFDYHDAGINDTLMMLESSEALRLCPEMPRNEGAMKASSAFVDADKNTFVTKETKNIMLRDFPCSDGVSRAAHVGSIVDCRVSGNVMHSDNIKVHFPLDVIVNRGRLPALAPYTSTRITMNAPIRRMKDSGIELNAVVGYEHVAMVMESSISMSKILGVKDHQEKFKDKTGLDGLSARNTGGETVVSATNEPMTKLLPFSNDLVQMNWIRDLSERQFNPNLISMLESFNAEVEEEELGEELTLEQMPQQYLPCMGYPVKMKEGGVETIQMLSLPVKTEASTTPIEVGTAMENSALSTEALMDQVARATGSKPADGDITTYRRSRVGDAYMHEVEGDLNSYDTWTTHTMRSMINSGNGRPECDLGMFSLMDAEMMLWPRKVERLAQKKNTVESTYNIFLPWGQTYTALERKTVSGEDGPMMPVKRSKRPSSTRGIDAMSKIGFSGIKKSRAETTASSSLDCGGAIEDARDS